MTERYPDDATLLAIEQDGSTGVEYIPTGRSPYYLEFRKLVQRLLLATTRANDLRVYADGDLSVGVRPGRCAMHGQPIAFAGATQIAVDNNQITAVWLDDAGAVQTGTDGFPADRTRFVPLAEVTAAAGAIAQIDDRRGEAFLAVPDVAGMGLTATAAEIDQALAGIAATVDAAALSALTAGGDSAADGQHRHERFGHDADAEAALVLANDHGGAAANVALKFDLLAKLPGLVALGPDAASGWLRQRFLGDSYALVGVLPVSYARPGELTASVGDALIGAVPADGVVSDVILSVGGNIESDDAGDGVAAVAAVNGTPLTTTPPAITDAAGAGFRSTARGDGTPASVKTDGTEQVSRGDVLTVTLTRTANGTITSEVRDATVLVVIRPGGPE